MTDEKKKKPRRPAAEIAAEKRAWLAKHEWQGMRDAVDFTHEALKMLAQAQRAIDGKVSADFKAAEREVGALREALIKLIPPEAR